MSFDLYVHLQNGMTEIRTSVIGGSEWYAAIRKMRVALELIEAEQRWKEKQK